MTRDFVPRSDALLVAYTNNFSTGIAGTNAAAVGLNSSQSTNFASLNLAWIDSFAVLQNNSTWTPAAVITKNQCKAAVVSDLRALAGIIQKFPATTNQQRTALGLTIRKSPSPIGPPESWPLLEVVGLLSRTVTLAMHDSDPRSAALKPAGVKTAQVYSFIGANPPADVSGWNFEGSCSRSTVKITFASSVPNGAQIWFRACWLNQRQQAGPPSPAITTTLPGAVGSSAA